MLNFIIAYLSANVYNKINGTSVKLKGALDMDRIVKVGIIGCGGVAKYKHLPALSKVKNVQLVAFCDIIVERAQKVKEKYGTS